MASILENALTKFIDLEDRINELPEKTKQAEQDLRNKEDSISASSVVSFQDVEAIYNLKKKISQFKAAPAELSTQREEQLAILKSYLSVTRKPLRYPFTHDSRNPEPSYVFTLVDGTVIVGRS